MIMDVAVLGLGIMGAGMAANLLRAGHQVRVWNRTPAKTEPLVEAGAVGAATATEAIAGAEVVVTMLFDLESTVTVVSEAAGSFAPGAVWVQTATVGLDGSAQLAELAVAHGIPLVDAPVMGTKKPAQDGTLVVLASGDPALRARVDPVLDAISSKTIWVGPEVGAGSALKLACNAWVLSITAATAQSVALTASLGLDPFLFLEAIAGGGTDSPYAQLKGRSMIARDYSPSFAVDGAVKDLGLILAAQHSHGVNTGLLSAVREAFSAAQRVGLGGQDIAAVHAAMTISGSEEGVAAPLD
jgi:3-hydroxyisobutyrate dehydrogenase